MKKALFLFIILFSSLYVEAGKNAKYAYMFFESENGNHQTDSLINISVDLLPYWTPDGWGLQVNNPMVKVAIENISEDVLFIDLGSSFFSNNKKSLMFWDKSQKITTNSSNSNLGLNVGALTSALGIGGFIGNVASGINIGGGSGSSTSTIEQEERILRIPPLSEEVIYFPVFYPLDDRKLFGKTLSYGGNALQVARLPIEIGEAYSYSIDDTPLLLSVFIKYSASEDFVCPLKANIKLWAYELLGTKENISNKKSETEVMNFGKSLDVPYIKFKFK